MALGAQRQKVLWMILRDALVMVFVYLISGIAEPTWGLGGSELRGLAKETAGHFEPDRLS